MHSAFGGSADVGRYVGKLSLPDFMLFKTVPASVRSMLGHGCLSTSFFSTTKKKRALIDSN
jgi:hypothetical protein